MLRVPSCVVWYSRTENYKVVGIITGFQNVWYSIVHSKIINIFIMLHGTGNLNCKHFA